VVPDFTTFDVTTLRHNVPMPSTILGLDIGGANLKAATPDKRAVSVPFALWKQPDRLPAALAELIARFPDAEELAVTMTGELCDCYETRREGVNAIINAIRFTSGGRRIRVWSTDGVFVDPEEATREYLKVASANWHALATFAGRFVPTHAAFLIDIGSTTTDVIPIEYGVPCPVGSTDTERLRSGELFYSGIRRTPVCAVMGPRVAAELFATTQDVYLALGRFPDTPEDRDTADGRPATRAYALARLARMLCGDTETLTEERILEFAHEVQATQVRGIFDILWHLETEAGFTSEVRVLLTSGAGEFLVRDLYPPSGLPRPPGGVVSLADQLGPQISACAPAYAVAVLATERANGG
jgi:probable H4MPT-linked C1 transfer pathway protein